MLITKQFAQSPPFSNEVHTGDLRGLDHRLMSPPVGSSTLSATTGLHETQHLLHETLLPASNKQRYSTCRSSLCAVLKTSFLSSYLLDHSVVLQMDAKASDGVLTAAPDSTSVRIVLLPLSRAGCLFFCDACQKSGSLFHASALFHQ